MRFQYPNFEIISYQLGAVAAFAEMVSTGMKKLAFSGIIEEKDLAVLEPGIKEITEKYHVSYHCQYNLIKSELAGDEQIKDRYVFLIYRDKEVLDEYFKLA